MTARVVPGSVILIMDHSVITLADDAGVLGALALAQGYGEPA